MHLEIDEIKELCTEASFERGERYLREGRVEILKASPTRITAVVQGREEYDVEVDLKKDISAECTCPYDWEGYCKHIVAVLLSILDRGDDIEAMMAKDASEKEAIEAMLEGADPEDLRRFLRMEMEDLQPLKDHFMACFSRKGVGKSLGEYRKEIDHLFGEMEPYDGYIPYGMEPDFSSFEDLAQIYISKRDFSEAAKIYQALFESIEERAEYLYDSEGYFVGKFSDFLNSYVACLKDTGLDAEARRGLIKYLFDKYIGEEDYFQDEYLDSLERLCTLQEDLEYWLDLLEAHVPEEMPGHQERDVENYRAAEHITTKLRLLSALERKRDYYALVEQFYRYVPDICLSYAVALREDKKDRAIGEGGRRGFVTLSR